MMETFVKLAFVGTGKSRWEDGALDEHPAAALLAALPVNEPEHRLLILGGVRAVCDRCGRLAGDTGETLPPAPVETAPECSRPLVSVLQAALTNKSHALLGDFLGELERAGIRLPAELLPQVLEVNFAPLRERIVPVLGQRGLWLSRLREPWRWASVAAAASGAIDVDGWRAAWDEGTMPDRCRALAALRRHDPALARQWLAEAFDQEKADQRVAFLETFEHGLSAQDEEFLSERLDDRSEQVRRVAARWLARLPASELAQRMVARAQGMLSLTKTGLIRKTVKLACQPPEEIDKSWERDGIAVKPPAGRGKRAYWAESVLALIPPTHWNECLAMAPAQLIAAAGDDDFAQAILAGWTTAALAFKSDRPISIEWRMALAAYWCGRARQAVGAKAAAKQQAAAALGSTTVGGTALGPLSEIGVLAQIVGTLPREQAEAVAAPFLSEAMGWESPQPAQLCVEIPRPWSAGFAQVFLKQLSKLFEASPNPSGWCWTSALGVAALAVPREQLSTQLAVWEHLPEPEADRRPFQKEIDAFTEALRARQSFFDALDAMKST